METFIKSPKGIAIMLLTAACIVLLFFQFGSKKQDDTFNSFDPLQFNH